MQRKIVQRHCAVSPVDVPIDWEPRTWLATKAREQGLKTLLAHADDGVIWGYLEEDGLHLSGDSYPKLSPPLRRVTLQEARLFGLEGELHLWRDEENSWQACLIRDGAGAQVTTLDEFQVLWGTRQESEKGGFALVTDGQLGHRHAPPVPGDGLSFAPDGKRRPLRLQVRHYLDSDDTGLVHVSLSRLVALLPDTEVES